MPDGSTFASGGKDGNVRFYDLDHGDVWMLDHMHPNSVEAIAHGQRLETDGEDVVLSLFTASADHTAVFWAYVRSAPGPMQAQRIRSYRFHAAADLGLAVHEKHECTGHE